MNPITILKQIVALFDDQTFIYGEDDARQVATVLSHARLAIERDREKVREQILKFDEAPPREPFTFKDHGGDCAKQQNYKSECTCGLKDRVLAQDNESFLEKWMVAHAGDCQQCREVMEAFYAEMRQPHPLCSVGREILQTGRLPS